MLVQATMVLTQFSIVIRNGHRTAFSTFLQEFGGEAHTLLASNLYHFWRTLPEGALHRLCDKFLPTNLRNDALARWRDFNTFRLLELPLELREMIIAIALACPRSMVVLPLKTVAIAKLDLGKRNLALMRTSKQMYQEATQVLHRQQMLPWYQCSQCGLGRHHGLVKEPFADGYG